MRTCFFRGSVAAAAALTLSIAATAHAAVVYQETFGYYDGSQAGPSGTVQTSYFGADWDFQKNSAGTITDQGGNTGSTVGAVSVGGPNGFHSGGAVVGTPQQTSTAGPVFLTAAAQTGITNGVTTTVAGGNTLAAYSAAALKFGVGYNTIADGTVLEYTKEYAAYSGGDVLNTVNHPGLTFSWYEGNGDATGGYSAAVKVGGQWYVTAQVFANADVSKSGSGTAGLQAAGVEEVVPYTSSTVWNLLSFDGDYTFTPNALGAGSLATTATQLVRVPGSVTLDTTLPIQAFGMFSDVPTGTSNRRFDSFTVTDSVVAAPEPASIALLGAGALLMVRRKKA